MTYSQVKNAAADLLPRLQKQVEEIATLLGGRVEHDQDHSGDGYIKWLSSNVYLPNGMGIWFRNGSVSTDKPVLEISPNWNIDSRNGSIVWDRIAPLNDSKHSRNVNIHCSYKSYGTINRINVSALKSNDRIAKEIKSRMLTADADIIFSKHLEDWIREATYVANNKNRLTQIASLVASEYPINIDRVTSDCLNFSVKGQRYQHVKIQTSSSDRLNISITGITHDQVMEILKITNSLK